MYVDLLCVDISCRPVRFNIVFFFFNDTATTEIYTLSLHDALPISERAGGEAVDRRSDLYSLGATLYELIAGRPPFPHRNQLELLEAIIYQDPPSITRINPRAPVALCGLAERLIQKHPGDRPENAAEVALLLRVIGRGVWGFSDPLLVPRPREARP